MFNRIFLLMSIFVSLNAKAIMPVENISRDFTRIFSSSVAPEGLNWKVGDRNEYNVNMSIIKGTIVMTVREIVSEGIWVDQAVDLGFAGKQNASMLYDANTGELKRLIVDGKEQEIPKSNMEIIETKADRITVPAGTFDCIHARLLDKETNKEMNAWINPRDIPISGMLKAIQPGQMGNVTLELKAFKKH